MSEPKAFQDIAETIRSFDDWEDRYRYLIELGQALPKLTTDERMPENKVTGCISQVWLIAETITLAGQFRLKYRGESDAMIVQGLVAILFALYSDRPAHEIAETDAMVMFDKIGLSAHLSTQRTDGVIAMANRIQNEAKALL